MKVGKCLWEIYIAGFYLFSFPADKRYHRSCAKMPFDEEELKKLKVADLKTMLSERNLVVSGKKEELIQRLMESETAAESPVLSAVPSVAKSPGAVSPVVPLSQVPASADPLSARQARFGVIPPPAATTSAGSSEGGSMKDGQLRSKVRATDEGNLHIASGKGTALDLSPDDIARIRARQERFGTTAPVLQALEALDKRQQRADRFPAPPSS